MPCTSPGMADHAPSQGQVVVGEGPVRSTGFSEGDFRGRSAYDDGLAALAASRRTSCGG